ncbi:hypothetical protein NDU88_006949 [Pleurodeles waltl]|uniref:Uncharacterized protein n=1 Tax=Pleurodeles waltl TaxID=8319 RepID=A0AAV7PMD6_PLEWA|nr:hypothetical protein NDU88_006949 [Pleurodeles waltl]
MFRPRLALYSVQGAPGHGYPASPQMLGSCDCPALIAAPSLTSDPATAAAPGEPRSPNGGRPASPQGLLCPSGRTTAVCVSPCQRVQRQLPVPWVLSRLPWRPPGPPRRDLRDPLCLRWPRRVIAATGVCRRWPSRCRLALLAPSAGPHRPPTTVS